MRELIDWKERRESALRAGSSQAHRYTKSKVPYPEELRARGDGGSTAPAHGVLEQLVRTGSRAWGAQPSLSTNIEAPARAPPRVRPGLLRGIPPKFKAKAIAIEGAHPKYSPLSTSAMQVPTGIHTIMNMVANAPTSLQQAITALFRKPERGGAQ
ncbi:unnamed protein product [Prorocentrum cordatum]|uniref:Uncharacterized protein n=1 Tax=Prorocentrum cordatum TaxID=2364126 RepID=A0ABN9WSQ5_9DINO|nr:unnamed protein product [Polarella glacialis]